MKYIFGLLSIVMLASFAILTATADNLTAAPADPAPTPKPAKVKTIRELTFTEGEFDGQQVAKTEKEWKSLLTGDEYNVLRKEGTEAPDTGALLNNKKAGTYHCAACGLALFASVAKYNSHTGWPSFFQPIFKKNVVEKTDRSLDEVRIEVECARCGGHLGHVFDDGPKPTGLRYCINSLSLRFKAAN